MKVTDPVIALRFSLVDQKLEERKRSLQQKKKAEQKAKLAAERRESATTAEGLESSNPEPSTDVDVGEALAEQLSAMMENDEEPLGDIGYRSN